MKKWKEKYKDKEDHNHNKKDKKKKMQEEKDQDTEDTLRIILEQATPKRFRKPKKKICKQPLLIPIQEDQREQQTPSPVVPNIIIEQINPEPPPPMVPNNMLEQLFLEKFGQFHENNPIDYENNNIEPEKIKTCLEENIGTNNNKQTPTNKPYEPWIEKTKDHNEMLQEISEAEEEQTLEEFLDNKNLELLPEFKTFQPLWENNQSNEKILEYTNLEPEQGHYERYQPQTGKYLDYKIPEQEANHYEVMSHNNHNKQNLDKQLTINGLLDEENTDNNQTAQEQQSKPMIEEEQWEQIEITTNVKKLRNILNMKLPTWFTIVMLMAESTLKINAAEHGYNNITTPTPYTETMNIQTTVEYGLGNETTPHPYLNPWVIETYRHEIHPAWNSIKRETFRPVENIKHPGPLFSTTKDQSMVEIQKGNFSIQLETNYKNPYIKTTIEIPTESYDEYTQIIDIKDLSIQNWNAIRFLSKETDQGFQDYMNFKSIKQETNIYATENKNYEYYKYPNIIGYPDCNLACPIMNADMPKTPKQLKDAKKLFNLTKEYIWVHTNQTATQRESWTWTHKYDYKILFDNKEIYPNPEPGFTPLLGITAPQECKAYKNGIMTDHEKIGYQYYYWLDGNYHHTSAYRLQTAISTNWDCKIIIMREDHVADHLFDDNTCICVREKKSKFENSMNIEMTNLKHTMMKQTNNTAIEEWRFLTTQSTTLLENTDDQMIPKNTKVNKQNLKTVKKKYLENKDLTNLRVGQTKSRTLRHKEMAKRLGKKMFKTILSHPDQLIKFHDIIRTNIGKEIQGAQVAYVDTNHIYGDSKEFADTMNDLFPSFTVTQDNNKISVTSELDDYKDWIELENIDSGAKIINGLIKSRKISANYDIFQETILRKIIQNIKVPMNQQQKKKTAYDKLTIVTIRKYSSYIELRILVPVILDEVTRIIKTYSLPHQIQKETGKYINKKVPEAILLNPGKEKPSTTRCGLDILQNKGKLDNCQNSIIALDEINRLTDLGEFSILMIRPLGETTVNCPQQKLQFLNFEHDISIIIVHQSCYINTEYLHIDPMSMNTPTEPGILALLSYDIPNENWMIPSLQPRWYLQLATITLAIIPLPIILACVSWVYKKKNRINQIAINTTTEQIVKKRIKPQSTETKKSWTGICGRNQKMTDENRHSYVPYHLEDTYVEGTGEDTIINREITKPDEEFIRDYAKDYECMESGNENQIEKVENFYATIKPKKKKHSQPKETMDIITEIDTEQNKNIEATTKGKPIITTHTDFVEKVAKRLQNNQIELPKRQPTSKGDITGWTFDKNPLHTHDMK